MEFVKFNRVAPTVVDAPESIRTESNYLKISLEDFSNIETYSEMSPNIRVLDFSDAFTIAAQEYDDYDDHTVAFKEAVEQGYFAHITEVVCANIERFEEELGEGEYQDYVVDTIKAFADFPDLIKLTLDGLPATYLSDTALLLKEKPHIYVSLLDIDVVADEGCGFDLQDVVDNTEEYIVEMEAKGVRVNASFKVENDSVLKTPKTWVIESVPVESVPSRKHSRSHDDVSDDEPAAKR